MYISSVPPRTMQGIDSGCGLGGVYDYINHFGYHIKEIWILKALWAVMRKRAQEEYYTTCMIVTRSFKVIATRRCVVLINIQPHALRILSATRSSTDNLWIQKADL